MIQEALVLVSVRWSLAGPFFLKSISCSCAMESLITVLEMCGINPNKLYPVTQSGSADINIKDFRL